MGPKRRKTYDLEVRLVRDTLCKQLNISEESVLPGRIKNFYLEHEHMLVCHWSILARVSR